MKSASSQLGLRLGLSLYRVAQKVTPLPNYQTFVGRHKPASEIIFLRQIKLSTKHYNIIHLH